MKLNMGISNKISFVKFCYISATLLRKELDLPTEQLVCLYNECIELLKYFHGLTTFITFVRFCYASATVLTDNLGLKSGNLICLYKECSQVAKHCSDKYTMILSCLELVTHSNSIGRHGDSLSYLKEMLPLVVALPDLELLIYQYLAMIYEQLQAFDSVVLHSRKCIDIAIKMGDKESEMHGYLSLGRAFRSLTRYNEAIDCGKKVLDIAQETHCARGTILAYNCIMHTHIRMQRYKDIIVCAQKLLDCALKANDRKTMINVYVELGRAHLALRQYQDAAACGKKLIETARDEIEDGSHIQVRAYLLMGNAYLGSSNYDTAIECCNKCIELAVVIGEKYAAAYAYSLLGSIYNTLEKYDDAIFNCKQCVMIDKKEVEAKSADATAYLTLGQANMCLEKFDEAIQNFKLCINTLDGIGQREETLMAAYLGLGDTYNRLEQYSDAVNYIEKVISMEQERNDKKTQIAGYSILTQIYMNSMQLHDLSQSINAGMAIAAELGDKQAEDDFKESLSRLHVAVGLISKASSSDVLPLKQSLVSKCAENDLMEDLAQAMDTGDKLKKHVALINLYKFYGFKKDYRKAIHCLQQLREVDIDHTVNLFCFSEIGHMYQAMGEYNTALRYYEEGLPTAQSCSNNRHRFKFYYGIGQLFFLLGRESNLTKRYLKEAVRCFEAIFSTLCSCDKFKISIFDEYLHSYKLLALVLINDKQIVEALLVLDRCRARALKDMMISNFKMESEERSDAEFRDALDLASNNGFSIAYYSLSFDSLFKFLFTEDATLDFSEYPNEFTIDDINRKYIDKLFNEIGVREKVNCEDRCLDVEAIPNPMEQKRSEEKYEGLNKLTPSLLKLDSTRGESTEKGCETKQSILEALYCILGCDEILPLKGDEVVIVPEGPLYQVPFPALRDPRTGQYLSEIKRIRLAPSLATLKHFEDDFPTSQTRTAKPLIIGSPLVGTVMMDGEIRDIEPLFGALDEAIDIAALLGVRPLVAANATKPAVLEKLREGVSVVHIAAHGILSKATIVLAPSHEIRNSKPIPDEEDYMLTMADVQQARVRAQLVVLSCCHSGRGEIRAEGVVGMCRAFLASGARGAVVASLWAIDDEATLAFMRIFYAHLKNGKGASTSLQLTMNEMRSNTEYKEAKKWSPFFLMGDDVTITL